MKKFTLLTFVVIIISFSSRAQISKGSVLLGGGIGTYSYQTENSYTNKQKNSSYTFAPAAGIAIKENKVLGLRLSYGRTKEGDYIESKSYGAGIFYRPYFSLGKSFYLFGDGTLSYGRGTSKYTNILNNSPVITSVTEITQNSIGVNVYPGVAYAVSRKFHLEAGVNNLLSFSYSSNNLKTKTDGQPNRSEKTSGFSLNTNFNPTSAFTFGFRFVLGN